MVVDAASATAARGTVAPVRPRIRAIAAALLVVAGACALARVAGLLLPQQPALVVAIAVVVVLPGWALGRACLGDRLDTVALLGASPVLGLAAWVPPLAIAFAVGLPFGAVAAMLAVLTVAMLAVRPLPPGPVRMADAVSLALLGVATTFAAGRWQEPLRGDEIFHLARARKLLAVPHLSLDAVSELAGGRPHAGYVFPLLHAAEAGALRLAGIDTSAGFPDLVPAAAVLLVLSAFAAGRAVAGTPVGVGTVALTVWASMIGLHPTLGKVSWPGPFTFLVLFPVGVLAVCELVRRPHDRRIQGLTAATVLVVALVHVSYAVPLLAIVAGAVAFARRGLAGALLSAAVALCVFGFVWLVALHGAAGAGDPRGALAARHQRRLRDGARPRAGAEHAHRRRAPDRLSDRDRGAAADAAVAGAALWVSRPRSPPAGWRWWRCRGW